MWRVSVTIVEHFSNSCRFTFLSIKHTSAHTHTGNTDDSMRYFKSKGLMFDIYVRRDKNGTTQIPINGRGETGKAIKVWPKHKRRGCTSVDASSACPHTNIAMCLLFVGSIIGGRHHFSSHKISHNMTGQIIIIIMSSSRNRTHTFAYFITLTNWIISAEYLTPSSAPFKMIDHVKFQ